MDYDEELFCREKKIIDNAVELIRNNNISKNRLFEEYIDLLKNYKKIIRQTNKMVKIGDKLQLQLSSLNDELNKKNAMLEDRELHLIDLVEEKTNKIERMTIALVNALDNVNLLNDTDTGNHIIRVSRFSTILAGSIGCDKDFVKRIKLYSSLHDVGKVGMPDIILKKRGIFSKEEFSQMKQHVTIGYLMLDNDELDPMAKNIALYHHEWWDGSGYINGLKGKKIPIEARIVALADVYDALTSYRVYKPPFSQEKTDEEITNNSGRHFDPEIVNVYFKMKKDFIEIKELYK